MEFRFEKNIKIINNLLLYCRSHGAKEYHLDISFQKDISAYRIEAELNNYSEKEMSSLAEILNTPRQHEIEHNFWGLSGEADLAPELELIGMMIDEAEVSYENGLLVIEVRRREGG